MLYYNKHQFVPVDRILELYFTGCSLKCKNCQNYFLQERTKDNTREVGVLEILEELIDYPNIATQVHILGGEPLEQDLGELELLLKGLKEFGFHDIILFTGKTLTEEEIKSLHSLLQYCDYLKVGNYDETNLNTEKIILPQGPSFPLASKNQYFIKVGM